MLRALGAHPAQVEWLCVIPVWLEVRQCDLVSDSLTWCHQRGEEVEFLYTLRKPIAPQVFCTRVQNWRKGNTKLPFDVPSNHYAMSSIWSMNTMKSIKPQIVIETSTHRHTLDTMVWIFLIFTMILKYLIVKHYTSLKRIAAKVQQFYERTQETTR